MAYKFQTLAATMSGSLTQEGDFTVKNDAGVTGFSATAGGVVSGSGALSAGGAFRTRGTVRLDGVVAADIAVAADSLYFFDATDNLVKTDTVADLMAAAAGDGLAASSGVLAVGVDDSSIELNSDALRVKAGGITNAMLADDAVGADELAANAVVNASIAAGAAIDMDKLDGGSCASALTDLAQGDFLYAGDIDASNAIKSITFSNFEDAIFGNVSGDATIAAGGALTIAATSVNGSMLNTDAISGQANMTGDVADTDELMISDGGTLKRIDFSVFRDAVFNDVSGDATVAAGGALTVAAGSIEHGMLAEDIISGQANLGGVGVDDADEFMISDGGTIKALTGANLYGWVFGKVSGDATVAVGGALTIAANAVQTGMVHDDVATELAGDGLAAASGVMAVQVSGAVHVSSDKVALSGSVAGTGLTYTGGVDSIATLALDISEYSALGSAGLHQTQDTFLFSDNGTLKTVTFSNLEDSILANISGDATVAAGGALTIAAGAVENSMLADDAVGADELAANAVVNASIASNAAIDLDKLDGGSCASALTDLAQGDFLYAGDVDDSNNIKNITFSNFEDAIFGNVSGDATIAAGGALTIAADAVEPSMMNIFDDSLAATTTHFLIADGTDYSSFALSGDVTCTNAGVVTIANDAVETAMLNDNIISGQTELAHADIADADEFMISDGGTLKRVGVDSLRDHYFGVVSGDATIADGGALTIAANAIQTGMVHDDVATELAGAGLTATSGVLSVTGNNVALKADSNALVEGYNYFADASANATVTLPTTRAVGDVVIAKAGNLTSNAIITINKGDASDRIDGLESIILESPYASVTMVYVVANAWRIV